MATEGVGVAQREQKHSSVARAIDRTEILVDKLEDLARRVAGEPNSTGDAPVKKMWAPCLADFLGAATHVEELNDRLEKVTERLRGLLF